MTQLLLIIIREFQFELNLRYRIQYLSVCFSVVQCGKVSTKKFSVALIQPLVRLYACTPNSKNKQITIPTMANKNK